ncbi:MAG TPA: 4Fe-4S binding protein [Spirochaetia bacterium]|nr:4Fe-4S binding protein [Spirochaetales bacterium]HPD80219.1 4Fe-4S binding protein [Spirochaetales bacterium]HQK35207.1 4Fe-4S binding protein [Spirochaetales bacterium]HRS65208.1 4Fe-4S binding protein [Spirochaetia bacterium]HRV28252.1 4Fe-4S binding protein [Spirochaetia bacterium]
MAKRTVIEINEDLCNGCGLCAEGCPEGALQIIDGKARLVGESLCDGLGACIGDCPQGAINKVEREAEAYSERQVIENIIPKGLNTIRAHLKHLKHHGQDTWYNEAIAILTEKGFDVHTVLSEQDTTTHAQHTAHSLHSPHEGCPGARSFSFKAQGLSSGSMQEGRHTIQGHPAASHAPQINDGQTVAQNRYGSMLEQWPIQLHLINPRAPYFKGQHILIAADCTAFAYGAFHPALLAGKKLIIACPKLDANKEIYVDKIAALIDDSEVASITVAIMEVPCCSGLVSLVKQALAKTVRKPALITVTIGINGDLIHWT